MDLLALVYILSTILIAILQIIIVIKFFQMSNDVRKIKQSSRCDFKIAQAQFFLIPATNQELLKC